MIVIAYMMGIIVAAIVGYMNKWILYSRVLDVLRLYLIVFMGYAAVPIYVLINMMMHYYNIGYYNA